MTLIMSYWHDPHSLIMLGDLLITRETPLAAAAPALPSRFSPLQNNVNEYIARLEQKLVIINPRLAAAWAGRQVVARNLLRRVRDGIGNEYTGRRILDLIASSGLAKDELESVAFIFYVMSEDGKLEVQDYLTKEVCRTPTHKFKFSGSGDFHFFESIGFSQTSLDTKTDPLSDDLLAILGRAAIAFQEEITTETPHNFFYGGGFELLSPDISNRRMDKIPHACAYWGFRGDEITLTGPIISYQYHDNGILQIDRLTQKDGTWWHDPFLVGNIFVTTSNVTPVSPKLIAGPIVHYLIDYGEERETLSFVAELGQKTLRMETVGTSMQLIADFDSEGFQHIKDGIARSMAART